MYLKGELWFGSRSWMYLLSFLKITILFNVVVNEWFVVGSEDGLIK
jgi:hypothetical protein